MAADHRGLYAYHTDGTLYSPDLTAGAPSMDWTFTYRTVGFDDHPKNDEAEVMAAQNVPGFRCDRANAILCGTMEAEMVQGLGRMRAMIPDPVDPSIIPHAFVFSGIPMPGVRTARTISLERLRGALGLEAKPQKKRGPKQKLTPAESLRAAVKKHGRRKIINRLVQDFGQTLTGGQLAAVPISMRKQFEEADLGWADTDAALVRDLVEALERG